MSHTTFRDFFPTLTREMLQDLHSLDELLPKYLALDAPRKLHPNDVRQVVNDLLKNWCGFLNDFNFASYSLQTSLRLNNQIMDMIKQMKRLNQFLGVADGRIQPEVFREIQDTVSAIVNILTS